MASTPIHKWLRRKTLVEALLSIPVAFVSVLISLPLLVLIFGIAYVASWFVFTDVTAVLYWRWNMEVHFSTTLHLSVAASFLLLQFLIAVQLNPEFLRDYPRITWPLPPNERYPQDWEAISLSRRFFSTVCIDCLLCGPRCALFGLATLRRALRLLRFDVKTCAKILVLLLQKGGRVPFEELGRTVPKILSRRILVQMHDIDGVVFLTQDPLGLTLTSDLRFEMRSAMKGQMPRFVEPEPEFRYTPPPSEPEPIDELAESYRVLGLSASASLREVKAAYRKGLKNCHPDRFHDFGDDWREMAARKTRELIEAYERIISAKATAVED